MSFVRLAPEQFDTIPGIPEPAESLSLVGHDEAVIHVADAYASNKLHHALLVVGPSGIGKATFAFHLAHYLLANPVENQAPRLFARRDPDSALFRQIAQGSHPGILHLTRAFNDKTGSFKSMLTVDEIRKVNRFLSMRSHDGGYRIVIVDTADDMNPNTANALLKTLEEPPPRALFILISHSPGRLLPTIRSRCQTIRLKPLTQNALIEILSGFSTERSQNSESFPALAKQAGGSVRDALLLTQFGGLEIRDAIVASVTESKFQLATAIRLADAVNAREAVVQFTIFNQSVLELVAGWACEAANEGNITTAARMSEFWHDTQHAIVETETYNLDKKQHVSGILRQMWRILHENEPAL